MPDQILSPEEVAAMGADRCTTHHTACPCREARYAREMAELRAERDAVVEIRENLTRLRDLYQKQIERAQDPMWRTVCGLFVKELEVFLRDAEEAGR